MSRGRVSFEERDTAREIRESEPDESQAEDYFSVDGSVDGTMSPDRAARRASLSIQIPPRVQVKADMAFAVLQYLPMPVLVLSSEKTIVLANEAMSRLFGIDAWESDDDDSSGSLSRFESGEARAPTDILYGLTLAQLGVDLLQNGNAVFVAWGDFLDSVVADASKAQSSSTQLNTHHIRGSDKDTTPTTSVHRRSTSAGSSVRLGRASGTRTEVHDAVVDVVFSTNRHPKTGLPLAARQDSSDHVQAQMIVSVWATEDSV